MKFPAFADLKPLIASGALTHVSFDVFDTFLLRRCSLPVGVFEQAYSLLPGTRTNQAHASAYTHYRQSAEQAARAQAHKAENRPEVSISEIYNHFPARSFGLTLAQRPLCAQAEYAAEQSLCFLHDQAFALYQALQQAGVKVGFLSDTYWNTEQLSALLRHCAPGLQWDFLYASCDHGVGKSSGLFKVYLKEQRIASARVAHIGDNPKADIVPARALGIKAFHCPQMTPAEAALYQRERASFDLFCSTPYGLPLSLDQGLTTLRRRVLAALPPLTPAQALGAQVMGPVMMAFDQFVRHAIRDLCEPPPPQEAARSVAVAFLARDGYFPLQVYQQGDEQSFDASYLAINRRISLIASEQDTQALAHFFQCVPSVTHRILCSFLHYDSPALQAYFAQQPGGVVSGEDFADALPALLSAEESASLALAMRTRLMTYLRQEIPNLDQLTDLLLVDIGYGGSVQRALRNTLDAAGLSHIRLHGRYLIPNAEGLNHVSDRDSAEGLLDDSVLAPHVSLSLRHNVAVLEQIWGAPHGSIKDYGEDGSPRYEDDPRSAAQLALSEDIRQGAYAFIRQAHALKDSFPFPSLDHSRPWAAALLTRFLLTPTDDELCLLHDVKLDVNLGSQTQIPLIDPQSAHALVHAKATISLFQPQQGVLWGAAQLASVSPQHGYLYSLFAAQKMPGDIFADAHCGDVSLIILNQGQPRIVKTTTLRTADNLLRLRVLIPGPAEGVSVLLPLEELGPRGHVVGVTWQTASNPAKAMADTTPVLLPLSALSVASDVVLDAETYTVNGPRPYLAITVPALASKVGLISITLRLAQQRRLLALTQDVSPNRYETASTA